VRDSTALTDYPRERTTVEAPHVFNPKLAKLLDDLDDVMRRAGINGVFVCEIEDGLNHLCTIRPAEYWHCSKVFDEQLIEIHHTNPELDAEITGILDEIVQIYSRDPQSTVAQINRRLPNSRPLG
jgi:hypothetical protein